MLIATTAVLKTKNNNKTLSETQTEPSTVNLNCQYRQIDNKTAIKRFTRIRTLWLATITEVKHQIIPTLPEIRKLTRSLIPQAPVRLLLILLNHKIIKIQFQQLQPVGWPALRWWSTGWTTNLIKIIEWTNHHNKILVYFKCIDSFLWFFHQNNSSSNSAQSFSRKFAEVSKYKPILTWQPTTTLKINFPTKLGQFFYGQF